MKELPFFFFCQRKIQLNFPNSKNNHQKVSFYFDNHKKTGIKMLNSQ